MAGKTRTILAKLRSASLLTGFQEKIGYERVDKAF